MKSSFPDNSSIKFDIKRSIDKMSEQEAKEQLLEYKVRELERFTASVSYALLSSYLEGYHEKTESI